MGRSAGQMITYSDLQYMVDNESYATKTSFGASLECPVKSEVLALVHLDTTVTKWTNLANNQLVPYDALSPLAVTYVGVGAECIQDTDPTPGTVTAPTIVISSQNSTSITISWTASPGSTPNGSISNYEVQVLTQDGGNPSWQTITPQLSGGTTTYVHTDSIGQYTFRVRLIDSTAVSSAWSNEITGNIGNNTSSNTNSLVLTWEVANTGNLWGEFKLEGDLATTAIVMYTITASSGTWYISDSYDTGIATLYSSSVNGNVPYYFYPGTQTLSSGAGFTYMAAVYGRTSGGGSITIKAEVISASNYSQAELPAPVTQTLSV